MAALDKATQNSALKKAVYILIILLAIDLLFLLFHYFVHYYKSGYFASFTFTEVSRRGKTYVRYYFSIAQDGGFGEMFQYFKFVMAGILLLYLSKLMRSKFLLLWAALSFFLFFDDWLGIHEMIGGEVIGKSLKSYGKNTYANGQLVYGILFTVLICIVGFIFWQRSSSEVKSLSLRLFLSLGVLWTSAVLFDHLRGLIRMHYYVGLVLEEGGEHFAASFFLFFCFFYVFKQKQAIDQEEAIAKI